MILPRDPDKEAAIDYFKDVLRGKDPLDIEAKLKGQTITNVWVDEAGDLLPDNFNKLLSDNFNKLLSDYFQKTLPQAEELHKYCSIDSVLSREIPNKLTEEET